MNPEIWFRSMLAVLAIILFCNHHIFHRKPFPKRKRAPLTTVDYWFIAAAWAWTASLLLYVLDIKWFTLSAPLPLWLRWGGVITMVLCLPLSEWIYRALGVHFSKRLELQDGHRLIKEGPYAYVRHPMYSTLFLCAIATCLISADALVIATTSIVVVAVLQRIKREEVMLLERFGDAYLTYRKEAGTILPKLLQSAQ